MSTAAYVVIASSVQVQREFASFLSVVGVVKNCVIGVSTKKDVCVVSYSERTN